MKTDAENVLRSSYELSRQAISDAVSPHDVILLLNKARVKHMLIGGHMLSFYTGSPRATTDVDVIVATTHVKRAVAAIKSAFPQFDSEDLTYNVRFSSRAGDTAYGPERIDIVRSDSPLFGRVIAAHAVAIESGGQVVHVPTAEAAVALKFAAAISPNRSDENRLQDHTDLVRVISRNSGLDRAVVTKLGDLVYPGGGEELGAFVTGVLEGRPVSL